MTGDSVNKSQIDIFYVCNKWMLCVMFLQFVGSPCGQHGPYTFYKAFKFKRGSKNNILSLGEFFFVKIFKDVEVCIGELQLLWEDRYNPGSYLSMVRLYFLPEQTPEGRKCHHGEVSSFCFIIKK